MSVCKKAKKDMRKKIVKMVFNELPVISRSTVITVISHFPLIKKIHFL